MCVSRKKIPVTTDNIKIRVSVTEHGYEVIESIMTWKLHFEKLYDYFEYYNIYYT